MTEKKRPGALRQEALHTIQCGQVQARIQSRQSNAGFIYREFTLSRCFTSLTAGKAVKKSSSFFIEHENSIIQSVREACEWIRNEASEPKPPEPVEEQEDLRIDN